MAMSQCTTFVLGSGKEEVKVSWDMTNGELSIERLKFPDCNQKSEDEISCDSKDCPNKKHDKHSFFFRANELNVNECMELAQAIQRAFFMLLGTKDEEEVQDVMSGYFPCITDDDDDDDDDGYN